MSLSIDIRHRLGSFQLDARFESKGRFGRSGAGKTSLINIIAGLVRADHGRVVVDGETLLDTGRGIDIPKHRRRIGYVFQEGRLFPHLTVRQNLLYGRWFTPKQERREELDRVVALLDLAHLLDRRPGLLSGGEKQRVAVGRALLASPRLLLMDEPLASLDEGRKSEILPYIERLRDEMQVPIVYVSHAISEVTRLATTMVLLSDGKVAAAGDVADVMGRLDLFPLTGRYEAGAVMETQISAHDTQYGLTVLQSQAGPLKVQGMDLPVGAPVRVHIRARDVLLAVQPPEGLSALNILPGTVSELGPVDGAIVDVRLDLNGAPLIARVTRLTIDRLGLQPGRPIYAVIKSIALDHRSVGRTRRAASDPE
jgi:molybdate transport system ATP-binding protein